MKSPLFACFITPDLFSVELHGKVYVQGKPIDTEGRVTLTVSKATLLGMADAIQAALNGYVPKPAADITMANGSTITLVGSDFEPEDLV